MCVVPPAVRRGWRTGAHRSGVSRTNLRAVALVALTLASTLALAGAVRAAERMIHVQGRVVDPSGQGVAGSPVRLFKTRRSLDLGRFSSGGQVTEATRTLTDENGYFEIEIPRDRTYDDYFLRFHDAGSFDRVKYMLPDDREITRELRRGSPLILEQTLQYHPQWEEVQDRIRSVGADSPRGRILRSMGIPEREMMGTGPDGPRTEWWYHTRGVVYFFRDGEAAGYRRFEPVKPGMEDGGV